MGRKTMDPRSCTSYHCKAYNCPCGITCILSELVTESELILHYNHVVQATHLLCHIPYFSSPFMSLLTQGVFVY